MEGTPARAMQKTRRALDLNYSHDLATFKAEFAALAGQEVYPAEVLVGLVDADTTREHQLPPRLKSLLDRHPALKKKLLQGELVGLSYAEGTGPRPATGARTNVLLIPAFSQTQLQLVVGIVTPVDDPQPSQEILETVREMAQLSAPIAARLSEIERLRHQNRELTATVRETKVLQQRLAELRVDKEKTEAMMKMGARLHSNMAHELRTPLAAVRGYVRMILDGKAGEINSTQRDYLTVLSENTNRLINLINWMGRIVELSAQYLKLSTFDLGELWAGCLRTHHHVLAEQSIEIREQFPGEPMIIMGDREKLAAIFNTLIVTAVQTGPRSRLAVEFTCGRDESLTAKFVQTGGTFDAAQPGFSEIHDIVGMHGGRVFLNENAGEGFALSFTLPAVTGEGKEKRGHEQAINPSRRRR